MPNELIFQDFVPYLHTRFRVATLDDYELTLTEANDLSRERTEQFSLIFTCPVLPWLPQGIYTLTPSGDAKHSEISLFLVPIGPNDEGMRYEAVFSRLAGGIGAPSSG